MQWFLRDFTGMLGGILFTFYQVLRFSPIIYLTSSLPFSSSSKSSMAPLVLMLCGNVDDLSSAIVSLYFLSINVSL